MKIRSTLKLPKEHGAWAMFYVPFVLGLLVAGKFNLPALLLLLSATAVFIARESLLVWWRARKRGRQTQSAAEAGRLLTIYFLIAAATGVPLIAVYKLYWLIPLGLAGSMLLLVNGWQAADFEDRTVQSEVLAIIGLTMTAPAAFYVANGQWGQIAWWLWGLSAAYFASSVFYVKLRVAWLHAKNASEKSRVRRQCVGYHCFLIASLLVLSVTGSLPLFALVAFAPVLARTLRSLLKPENHLNLKRIGIAEIGYSVVFLLFITLTFRSMF